MNYSCHVDLSWGRLTNSWLRWSNIWFQHLRRSYVLPSNTQQTLCADIGCKRKAVHGQFLSVFLEELLFVLIWLHFLWQRTWSVNAPERNVELETWELCAKKWPPPFSLQCSPSLRNLRCLNEGGGGPDHSSIALVRPWEWHRVAKSIDVWCLMMVGDG